MATFMAKINENLPGCGGHVHQSLWDKAGKKNLFYDEKDKLKMSALMKSYIAGQLYCLPYILPMFAPTINSYKRLVEGAWAPTTLTWGLDNRTVALRVLSGSSKSCRLETRVMGSDVNPYLAMAACLASGLYGIKNKLKLKQACYCWKWLQGLSKWCIAFHPYRSNTANEKIKCCKRNIRRKIC